MKLDLLIPEHSYLFGFILGDGHLSKSTRNRGKLRIELAYKDIDILLKFQDIIKYYSSIKERVRNTNFKRSHTATLTICAKEFREQLINFGMIAGRKSDSIKVPPICSEVDFWRGMIDSDGSLGFSKDGKPLLAFITKSTLIYGSYIKFIKKAIGKELRCNRNVRDNAYNMVIIQEAAQELASILYYPNALSLDRKALLAQDFQKWRRSSFVKKRAQEFKRWTSEQDLLISSNSIDISVKLTGRTKQSIKSRLWRIK